MEYLVSGMEMGQLDLQTIEEYGIPGRVLMETAGRAVARACSQHIGPPGRVLVACGTGNNGGDGFVVARALVAEGHDVSVFVFGDKTRIRGDARAALGTLEKAAEAPVTTVEDARALWDFSSALDGARLVVDALLGTGLSSDVRGILGKAIDVINESSVPVISVDMPSGVDADTGAIMGRGIDADATVTFGFAKRGHYLYPGAEKRGELSVVDIGIPRALAEQLGVVGRLLRSEDGPTLLAPRRGSSHKGHFGHVVVLAGSPQTPGAALLALSGALHAGAGLVSWATDERVLQQAVGKPPEVMLRVRRGESPEEWAEKVLDMATALVIGPGWGTGPERAAELRAICERTHLPLCLDADAINLIAEDESLWGCLRGPAVITPHPKEMARLIQSNVLDVQRDRFATALQFAIGRSCVVVLKGAGTVIAEPDGVVTVVGAGNPGMATGGTGDVLAGVVGSLLAQGLDPSTSAWSGALLHAAAGDLAATHHGQGGMSATDLVAHLGPMLSRWGR